ncbi:hypothetical protein D5086_015554 [Populus alba]|uniref:Uncharacterized protein n=1 Tax=Populus alba TaxID=43335 RepID=A0ACC4BS19_POPAL
MNVVVIKRLQSGSCRILLAKLFNLNPTLSGPAKRPFRMSLRSQSGTSVNILHIMCFSLEAETPDTSYLHLSFRRSEKAYVQ